jgi:phospholipid/cholesterol/gamma-HCH transport system ATP-binding protein
MRSKKIVEVNNLVVRYGHKVILNDISASFNESEIKVILGTSGCGKTTLLKTIVGLLKPSAGKVFLFGTEILDQDDVQTVDALKKIGILFQNGALLGSLTVAENVALPLQMHTDLSDNLIREIVLMKLSQVDLPHAAQLYPGELSGGMRKRAALARALVLDPPLLFCDEPSAGLDPVTSAGLDDLLLRLRKMLGITIVVVTHELMSIRKIADSIIFLHNGTVLFDGNAEDGQKVGTGPLGEFFARQESGFKKRILSPVDFNVELI